MESMPTTEHEDKQEFVIETICKDLEAEGYTVQPIVIPACAVGAPHRRDRVWFIACNNSFRLRKKRSKEIGYMAEYLRTNLLQTPTTVQRCEAPEKMKERTLKKGYKNGTTYNSLLSQLVYGGLLPTPQAADSSIGAVIGQNDRFYHYEERDVSESESERFERKCGTWKDFPSDEHTDCVGLEGRLDKEKSLSPENESAWGNTCGLRYWEDFPTQPPICRGDDGISDLLDTDAIFKGSRSIRQNSYSRWRTEAIKAYGNAMVPQVIYQIYKTINEIEQ